MKRLFYRLVVPMLLAAFISGCAGLPEFLSTPAPTASTATPTPTPLPVSGTAQPTPGRSAVLRVWVPPQLDPNADTPASTLFQQRLSEFTAQRPGLTIDVRVKAISGEAGLLDSLQATHDAAPEALPDLIALPREDMETAALSGLLHPMDGLTELLGDPDWYAYAQQMSHIQNTTYGLPFAGDALVLVYHPSVVGDLSSNWETIANQRGVVAFPAADPEALFTLCLYLSVNGAISDEQGQVTLDAQALNTTLGFLRDGKQGGLILNGVSNYQTDAQAWQAFREGRSSVVVTWSSRYFSEQVSDARALPLPGLDQSPYTMATGWVWSLGGSNPDNQMLAVKLAESLVESGYQAAWTEQAGYIPTRPTALDAWENKDKLILLNSVVESAQLVPTDDLTHVLGPVLQEATINALKDQKTIAETVQSALDALK